MRAVIRSTIRVRMNGSEASEHAGSSSLRAGSRSTDAARPIPGRRRMRGVASIEVSGAVEVGEGLLQ
jgi:hypothetical protein